MSKCGSEKELYFFRENGQTVGSKVGQQLEREREINK